MSKILTMSQTLGLLALTAPALAQTSVVPSSASNTEAISRGRIAGFSERSRMQVLYSSLALSSLGQKEITAIWFRRDQIFGHSYQSSTSSITVSVSAAQRFTTNASQAFADNRGPTPSIVFDGLIDLPANSSPPQPAPWDSIYAVRIPFSNPFPYFGSDLCVEIEGEPLTAPPGFYWSVDYEHEAPAGIVTSFGPACSAITANIERTAHGWGRNVVPGATFSTTSWGQPLTPCTLLLGSRLTTPIPLDSMGASGCELLVQPAIQINQSYSDVTALGPFGIVKFDVHLPAVSSLLSARFAMQWVNLEIGSATSNPARLTTTNGLDYTVAAGLPAGTLTTILSDAVPPATPFPATGRVSVSRGPVTRFDYRDPQ